MINSQNLLAYNTLKFWLNSFYMYVYKLWIIVCAPECSYGAEGCLGPTADDCCPFYFNDMCVDQCSVNMLPDEDFFCLCINFYTGTFCTGKQYTCMYTEVDSPEINALKFQS